MNELGFRLSIKEELEDVDEEDDDCENRTWVCY